MGRRPALDDLQGQEALPDLQNVPSWPVHSDGPLEAHYWTGSLSSSPLHLLCLDLLFFLAHLADVGTLH